MAAYSLPDLPCGYGARASRGGGGIWNCTTTSTAPPTSREPMTLCVCWRDEARLAGWSGKVGAFSLE